MVLIKYDKKKVILSNSLYSILNQLSFYKKYNYLNNPFISKIFYAFQDKSSFYIVKKYYSGGDLRYHMSRKIFSEQKAKFIVANIILGLEFLHSKGYIYRNLIPENLIFDKKGYLHINDMTLIREIPKINYLVTSGNPGYMAPEIIFRNKHGIESDFFSLGVILYEIMFNKLPYKANSREEYMNDLASTHNALIKEDELNIEWSRECADFINRCIQKKLELRIGFGDIEELKAHVWLKDFDWEKLMNKQLKAPFIPNGKNNYNVRYNEEEKIEYFEENVKNVIEYYEFMNYFNGYYYNYNLDEKFNKYIYKDDEALNGKNNEKKELNEKLVEDEIKEEEQEKSRYMDSNDFMKRFNFANNKKKNKNNNYDEENSYNENGNTLNINKKNKKNKNKNEDNDEFNNINYKENKNKKRKIESTDTNNFIEEESKGQLMNINNKKGLFNKNGNRRKSLKNRNNSKKIHSNDYRK